MQIRPATYNRSESYKERIVEYVMATLKNMAESETKISSASAATTPVPQRSGQPHPVLLLLEGRGHLYRADDPGRWRFLFACYYY